MYFFLKVFRSSFSHERLSPLALTLHLHIERYVCFIFLCPSSKFVFSFLFFFVFLAPTNKTKFNYNQQKNKLYRLCMYAMYLFFVSFVFPCCLYVANYNKVSLHIMCVCVYARCERLGTTHMRACHVSPYYVSVS